MCRTGPGPGLHSNVFCPVQVGQQPGGSLPDLQTTRRALQWLARPPARPWLLAVGLHKPHIPHKVLGNVYIHKYVLMYDAAQFPARFLSLHPAPPPPPNNTAWPPNLPAVAWNPWVDLRRREDVAAAGPAWPWGPLDPAMAARVRSGRAGQGTTAGWTDDGIFTSKLTCLAADVCAYPTRLGYYCAASYADWLVGLLVRAVPANTIVVFTSDHGWQLGERGEWSKASQPQYQLSSGWSRHTPKSCLLAGSPLCPYKN